MRNFDRTKNYVIVLPDLHSNAATLNLSQISSRSAEEEETQQQGHMAVMRVEEEEVGLIK